MKRQIWSFRLYKEGLRQLKIIGVMAFVILELAALLTPLGYGVRASRSASAGLGGDLLSYGDASAGVLSFVSVHWILLLLPTVVAPLMTLYLFRFLNKRSASDRYHQLPVRRECLFFSFFTAIVTWLVAITLISSLTVWVLFLPLRATFVISFTSMLVLVGNMLAGALLTAATVALVMSATGTLFSNVAGAVLLLFLPRLILLAFGQLLADALPLLPDIAAMPLVSAEFNVPVSMVINLIQWDENPAYTSAASGLYSFVLGLIYAGLAALLFRRRQSETAEQPASSQSVQMVLRMATGFVVSLIPCVTLCQWVLEGYRPGRSDLFWILVLYVLVLLALFIYELIATRKWKNLLRALASFAAVAGLDLLFILAVFTGKTMVLHFSPSASAISAVRVVESVDIFGTYAQKLSLTDTAVKEAVADALVTTNTACREWEKDYLLGQYGHDDNGDYTSVTVSVQVEPRWVTRRLLFTPEQYQILTEALQKDEQYRGAFTKFPALHQHETTVWAENLSALQSADVYTSLRREAAAADFHDWYNYLTGKKSGYTASGLRLYVSTRIGTGVQQATIDIPWEFVSTCNVYLRMSNENPLLLRLLDKGREEWPSVSLSLLNSGDGEAYLGDLSRLPDEVTEALTALLRQTPTAEKPLLRFDWPEEGGGLRYAYVNPDETTLAAITEWLAAGDDESAEK